jgi:ABC-type Mn2+/Zn2+ transport system ATPase subunit
VGFYYAGQRNRALADINLHINPGKITALAGENGSKKTTLVKLICRLCNPAT